MRRIILSLALMLGLAGCSTASFVGGFTAIQTADTAKHIMFSHIGDDEIANPVIRAHLQVIDNLLADLEDVDSGKELYKFFEDNAWMINQGAKSYKQIVDAVNEFNVRNKRDLPQALKTYDTDVRTAYSDILEAIRKRDKTAKVADFARLLVKILAAKQGIIL